MRFIPAVSPVRIQSPLPSTGETRERLAGYPLSKQRRPVGQVVKTRPFHGCNMGSSPVRVTTSAIRKRDCRINGGLAQLVRAPASHAGGHWFESSSLHQKVPDFVRNQELFLFMSSSGVKFFVLLFCKFNRHLRFLLTWLREWYRLIAILIRHLA